MATIYRLVTQLSADPAPMESGFARGLRATQAFARSAAQTLVTVPRNVGTGFAEAGSNAAKSLLSSLQKTYAQQQGQLTEALARGALSRAQFEELGAQSAKGFNTALLNSISTLTTKGAISPEVRASLASALKDAGIASGEAFATGLTRIGGKLRSLGRDFTQFGIEASLVSTAPLVAGARKAIDAAESISRALDRISVSTGAVGPQLESLGQSFTHLFSSLPNSADDIARALSGIGVASGATGPALDTLATQVLNLSRITGTDLASNVLASQRAFQAWGTTVANQAGNLDILFKVSQATGATVSSLSESMAHFAPALQQFGLSFAQSASLIGQFQKNGLDADSILTTLQTSLSRFAEKGIDGSHALQLLVDSVKKAATDADAINLASRVLGPRGAATFADAVRSGSLDIQHLTDTVRASANSIDQTAARTDTFRTAMTGLAHSATLAGSAIGETLERTFIAIAPALTAAANAVGTVARAFASLPPFVTDSVTVMLAIGAAVGPLALVMAGLTKATGAVALAFGLLKSGIASTALGAVGVEASAAATGMTAAATASGALAGGLALLGTVTGVGIVLAAIAFAINDLTKTSRDASAKLDAFKASLVGLSETQLSIKTDQLRTDLAARQKQIDDLHASAGGGESFFRRFARISSGELTGGETDASAQQRTLANSQDETQRKLAATTVALTAAKNATADATAAMAAFNDSIAQVIEITGKGITVDPQGHISGSLEHLQTLAKTLQAQLNSRVAIPGFDTTAATVALEHVQTALRSLENAGKPGLASIFHQLSPSIVALDREVSALVAKVQNLDGPLAQLSNLKLSSTILSDLADVNRQLRALDDSTSLDAEKLRAMQKALQSTAAAQIGTNVNHVGAFSIDIDGHIKSITVDPTASAGVVADIAKGLDAVRSAAEQAAALQLNFERVSATGTLRDIELAGIATTVAYRKARDAEDAFRATVDGSRISIDQQKAAIGAMLEEVARTGATQDKITLSLALDPDTLQLIQHDVEQTLAKLPKPELGLKVFVDALSIDNAITQTRKAFDRAQIVAISGTPGATNAINEAALDSLAKQFQELARTMDLTNPSRGDLDAFARMQDAASKLGISIADVIKRLQDLTPLGRAIHLADVFSGVASAVLGADSGIAKFADSLGVALKSAQSLKTAISEIHTAHDQGTSDFTGILDAVSAIGGIVGSIVSVGKLLSGITKDPLAAEHNQILKQNNDALAALTNSLDRQAGTAGRLDDVIKAFFAANDENIRRGAGQPGFDPAANVFSSQQAFTEFLKSTNVTFEQVNAAAKALGITFVDSHGNLTGLNDAFDAFHKQMLILTSLGDDLSAAQKRISVDNAINQTTQSPAQALKDQVDAVAHVLDAQGGTLGKSLEDASAQGPAALRKQLRALADMVEQGTIQLSDLGNFANATDFFDAIGTTADDLNALSGAANTLTDALLNVPAGFKRSLLEFNSQLPQAPPTPNFPSPPPPLPTDTVPTRPPDTGGVLLDLVKQIFTPSSATVSTALVPFVDALAKPSDALTRLSVSASDVADSLDRMFRAAPGSGIGGQSSDAIVGSARLQDRALRDVIGALAPITPGRSGNTGEVHFHGAQFNIDAKDKSISVVFDEIAAEARKRAHQKTGNSTRVLDAFQR